MSKKNNYIHKAHKFYKEQNFSQAIYWFSRAIAERPNDAELYSERAVAYYHNKDLKAALSDMDRARDLEPDRAYRYASRAYIKDAMGDLRGAISDYEKAIELDPDDAIAHNNLGLLEEKLGHMGKAKTLFDMADSLAGGMPESERLKPRNVQKEINDAKKEKSLTKEMMRVFQSRKAFSEFLTFIRKGFK